MDDLTKKYFRKSLETDLASQLNQVNFVYPRYNGESILNILPSVAELFGVKGFQHPGLKPELLDPIREEPDNIILVLLDALAYQRMANWLDIEENPGWSQIKNTGLLAPLTSICPSTTCAAITSFWTDSAAIQHGILGYEMWLKEYGITANMIEHKPITYRSSGGNLRLAGFDPETFLPVESIAGKFKESGIESHVFQHFAIINSGLSQMFMGEAERHPIATAPDMWINIRELLESGSASRKFIWAYWGQIDGTSHLHGPDSERAQAEFLSFSSAFDRYFWEKISQDVKGKTLVILTADHGQITTDKNAENYDLRHHTEFTDMLHLLPTGENRLAYLFIKPGAKSEVKDYIRTTWPEQFSIFEPEEAIQSGLFGPGPIHPATGDRIGDLIVAARGNAFWWWAAKPNQLIGRHGGLSPQEMLVPFLAGWL